jgi:hypothetical protein
MALLFECTPQCARKLLDTADIVREAIYQQLTRRSDLFLGRHEWRFGMKSRLLLLSWVMLSVFLYGQQVAQIDLVAHQIPEQVASANSDTVLAGCESPSYKHSDGAILETEGRPKLTLEVALAKQIVHQGETVDAQVLMRNIGSEAVVIPWSVDPEIRKHSPDAVQHEYELGWFELELVAKNRRGVPLESESQTFFLGSSESNPQSKLRLEPGQWVTAKIRFAIDEKRHLSVLLPIKPGKAEVSAHWRQARYTWHRDGCTVETGYFSYDYQEDARPVSIEILK